MSALIAFYHLELLLISRKSSHIPGSIYISRLCLSKQTAIVWENQTISARVNLPAMYLSAAKPIANYYQFAHIISLLLSPTKNCWIIGYEVKSASKLVQLFTVPCPAQKQIQAPSSKKNGWFESGPLSLNKYLKPVLIKNLFSKLFQQFDKAAEDVRNLKVAPSIEDFLAFYSLYKQATAGDCNIGKWMFLWTFREWFLIKLSEVDICKWANETC